MVTEYVAGYFETIGRNGIADLNDNNSGYDHYNGGNDGKDSRARFVKKKKEKPGQRRSCTTTTTTTTTITLTVRFVRDRRMLTILCK